LETSVGLGRLFLAVVSEAYDSEILEDGTERKVLRLKKHLAPVKIAILPLMKKDGLSEAAMEIFDSLSGDFAIIYSDASSVGKRYRKQDEIGTPYCITIDYESLEEDTVTVRDRDTMGQERVKIDDLENYFFEKFRE
jgi:glycyl-tRNA synthetase